MQKILSAKYQVWKDISKYDYFDFNWLIFIKLNVYASKSYSYLRFQ